MRGEMKGRWEDDWEKRGAGKGAEKRGEWERVSGEDTICICMKTQQKSK